ncbi:hypothetical protein JCM8097_002081 [Rhodosporidiobolus ruineniae]
MTAAGPKSYASVTTDYVPLGAVQPTPNLAFLDSAQPANQAGLTDEQRAVLNQPSSPESSPTRGRPPKYHPSSTGGDKQGMEEEETKEEKREFDGLAGLDSKKPGAPFQTTLKGHRAMDGFEVDEKVKDELAEPYMPRANIAATLEAPNGTQAGGWAEKHKDESVLQQHVAFFDKDGDGYIYPWDIFKGFHELGYALPWCFLAVCVITVPFSLFTADRLSVLLRGGISVKDIHRAKHGSDTGTYDSEGRFLPARFEAIFSKFDEGDKGGLTFWEALKMIHRNRNVLDPVGWIGAFFEMFATWLLNAMTRADLRTVYDGSLFFAVAEREKARRRHHGSWFDYVPVLPGLFKENRAPEEPHAGSRRHKVKA